VPTNVSFTSHYRTDVAEFFKGVVDDNTILKFKDELVKSVEKTLQDLKFNP
jgi:hypothetical protein